MRTAVYTTLICLLPLGASADPVELSQDQMRRLVAAKTVLSTETIVATAAARVTGTVMDVRGFLADENMTYRLLVQRPDGVIVELLINGVTGQAVPHSSTRGQTVGAVARSAPNILMSQSSKSITAAPSAR